MFNGFITFYIITNDWRMVYFDSDKFDLSISRIIWYCFLNSPFSMLFLFKVSPKHLDGCILQPWRSCLLPITHVFWYTQGNLGILDISSRGYTTVMRSHTGRISSVAIDPYRKHLATVSEDHTIRVWDSESLQQVGNLVNCF